MQLTIVANLLEFMGKHADALIAVAALGVSIFTLLSQRKHDRISLRPLAAITLLDFDNCIKVTIRNAGVGPMILSRVITQNKKTGAMKGYPIDWFSRQPFLWNNFNKPAAGRVLAVGDQLELLHYSTDRLDDQTEVQRKRDINIIRSILKDMTIQVAYMDIYDKAQPVASRDLAWFGRKIRI